MRLPEPRRLGLERDAVVAVRASGLVLYRLVHANPPAEADFQPMTLAAAEARRADELLRVGLSFTLTPEQAARVPRRRPSPVARVELPDGTYAARTGRSEGHVTVWARPREPRTAHR